MSAEGNLKVTTRLNIPEPQITVQISEKFSCPLGLGECIGYIYIVSIFVTVTSAARAHTTNPNRYGFASSPRATIWICLWAQVSAINTVSWNDSEFFHLLPSKYWRFVGANRNGCVGTKFRWSMLIVIWLANHLVGSFFFNSLMPIGNKATAWPHSIRAH